MQAISQSAAAGKDETTVTAQAAIELIEKTLEEDFCAGPDPEPDDELQSELDMPSINRLRQAIGFLRALVVAALGAAMLDPMISYFCLRWGKIFLLA